MEPKTNSCPGPESDSTYVMSNGIIETRPFVPFIVRVANLGEYPIHLKKGTILGTASSDPNTVIAILEESAEFGPMPSTVPRSAPINGRETEI